MGKLTNWPEFKVHNVLNCLLNLKAFIWVFLIFTTSVYGYITIRYPLWFIFIIIYQVIILRLQIEYFRCILCMKHNVESCKNSPSVTRDHNESRLLKFTDQSANDIRHHITLLMWCPMSLTDRSVNLSKRDNKRQHDRVLPMTCSTIAVHFSATKKITNNYSAVFLFFCWKTEHKE